MTTEVYNNDASTSLAAGVGTGDTSITVVSSQEFNTTGTFRIRIDDEIMAVTGVAGTTWTVTRAAEVCEGAQTAAVHSVNAAVYGVLTAAALINGFSGGAGTVTSVSVVNANGVSGTVANVTTTPALTLALGAITPTTVAATGNVSSGGNIGATGTVAGSNLSGTNTGDQSLTGLVPKTTTVNGHALSSNVAVSASDVGAPSGSGTSTGSNTGDQTIALTGDVTGTGTGSFAATVANHAVSYAKMQQASASTLLGNASGSTANVGEITLGTNLSLAGSVLNASGAVSSVGLSLPAQFTVTVSPITTTGTLTATLPASIILADGSQAFTAAQSMGSHKLTNVTDPTGAQDAATKNYVDTQLALIAVKQECQGASTATLAASTYANGASGVGATITLTVAAVLVLDGYTPALNDRLLIKNQTDPTENGIYSLTTVGVALGAQAVLTRTLDFDQASDGINGAFVFIQNGTVNAKTGWLCSTFGTITFGHGGTSINWIQDAGSGTYTGTTPIAISASNVVSLGIVPATLGGLAADTSGYTSGQIPVAQGAGVYSADSRRGLYTGLGAPAAGLGYIGDFYIDFSVVPSVLYQKS